MVFFLLHPRSNLIFLFIMDDEDDPFAAIQQFIDKPVCLARRKDDALTSFDEEVDDDTADTDYQRSKKQKDKATENDDDRRKTRQRQNLKVLRKFTEKKTPTGGARNKKEPEFTEEDVLQVEDNTDDEICHVSPLKHRQDGCICASSKCSCGASKSVESVGKKRKTRQTKKQHQVIAALDKICAVKGGINDASVDEDDPFNSSLPASKRFYNTGAAPSRVTRSKATDSQKGLQPTSSAKVNKHELDLKLDSSTGSWQLDKPSSHLSISGTSSDSSHTDELHSVSVRHLARAKIDRFMIRSDETFDGIIRKLIDAETAERNAGVTSRCRRVRCALTYQGTFVRPSTTLSELGWTLGDQLEVAFVELLRLTFCTSDQHRKTTLECSSDDSFASLLDRLATDLRVATGACLTLQVDGVTIDLQKTPNDYELEDEERIDVHIQNKTK